MVKIEEIDYFARKRSNSPEYSLIKRVEALCANDPNDRSEFNRRLESLANVHEDAEHQLQAGNLVSEFQVFYWLHEQKKLPYWVPESKKKCVMSPDLYFDKEGAKFPVEVKTINLPEKEGDVLRKKIFPGLTETVVPPEVKFYKKIDSSVADALEKFRCFHGKEQGSIYFLYIPSLNVRINNAANSTAEAIQKYIRGVAPSAVNIYVHNAWTDSP